MPEVPHCLQIVGKGVKHPQPCGLVERRDNLENILDKDPRGAELLATSVIKDKVSESEGNTIQLATSGPNPLTIPKPDLPPSRARKALFKDEPVPASEVCKLMQVNNLSKNQLKKQSAIIRTWKGRKVLEPEVMKTISEMDMSLEPFFGSVDLEFDSHDKNERESGIRVSRSVSYCNDLSGLLQYLVKERGFESEEELRKKIGVDAGGGFLKVCLNLEEETHVQSENISKKQRFSYTRGAFSSQFKDSGVKKLLILAITENVCENYNNLKLILDLVGIPDFDCVHAMDMKAANSFLGVGTASSTYPCTWCHMKKVDFGKDELLFVGGTLRTLGSIRQNAKAYSKAVSKHKGKAKLTSAPYFNCEHPPICNKEDSTLVLDSVPPMELHIYLGAINKLYDHLDDTSKKIGRNKTAAHDWAKKCGMTRQAYHNGTFNGPQCSKLLTSLDGLKVILGEDLQNDAINNIVFAFEAAIEVKSACFGQTALPNYQDTIKNFGMAYMKLNISVTPKVHALLVHVSQFLERQNGEGLGVWSEQASESVHQDFSALWINSCYKRDIVHHKYASQLLRCVITYNSRHV